MSAKAVVISPASITQTFWSLIDSMYAISKNEFGGPKSPFPPLGPMMIGGCLKSNPNYDEVTLVDRNVDKRPLREIPKVRNADQVWVGYWSAQQEDFENNVVPEINSMGKPLYVGGRSIDEKTLAKIQYERAVIGEAETVMPILLDDIFNGRDRKVYVGSHTPPEKFFLPDYSLINKKNYVSMNAQFSRGCPFDCEFCNITEDDGKEFRFATDEYVKANLEAIIATGFRGHEFIVDDNFIGNPKESIRVMKAMNEVEKKHGIYLPKYTQMSMNISDETPLMDEVRYWLRETRFVRAFLGIETPNEEALRAAGKRQNLKGERSIEEKLRFVSKETGMVFMAGGVFGFDQDSAATVQPYIDFFNSLPIPTEMIGLLLAPEKTRLYRRLVKEGRMIAKSSVNNSEGRTNFVPMLMSAKEAEEFYVHIIEELYNPNAFFNRVKGHLGLANPKELSSIRSAWESAYSVFKILLAGPNRSTYWKHLPEAHKIAMEKHSFISPGYQYVIGEYLTNCAQYAHFKKQLEFLKEQAKGRQYVPLQQQSWKEMQAAKNVVSK